jgi:hypothetical protein
MLAYCDKIADIIRKSLLSYDPDNIVGLVGAVKMDLHPLEGYFLSTRKTIEVMDMNGKKYLITVEEKG